MYQGGWTSIVYLCQVEPWFSICPGKKYLMSFTTIKNITFRCNNVSPKKKREKSTQSTTQANHCFVIFGGYLASLLSSVVVNRTKLSLSGRLMFVSGCSSVSSYPSQKSFGQLLHARSFFGHCFFASQGSTLCSYDNNASHSFLTVFHPHTWHNFYVVLLLTSSKWYPYFPF